MKKAITDRFLAVAEEILKMKKLPKMANFQGEAKMLHYLSVMGEISPSEISEKLCVTTARVATALNSLEKKDLVLREASKEDRRKIIVKITKKGKKLVDEKRDELHRNISKSLDMIGEEDAETLIRIISKFTEKISEKKEIKK